MGIAHSIDATSDDSKKAFFDKLDNHSTFLCDCDGVLWRASKAIPGSAEAVNALMDAGKRVIFMTNNSTKSRTTYVKKLESHGIKCTADDVLTSSSATAAYLKGMGFKKKAYVIGESGLREELSLAGIKYVEEDDNGKMFDFATFGPHLLDPDVGAVVQGFDSGFCTYKMNMASMYMSTRECLFIATNRDRTFPAEGFCMGGAGSQVIATVYAIGGREPDVVPGKPSLDMLRIAEKSLGVKASECVMVGDRVDTDMLFGNNGGCTTLLVLSGISKPGLVESLPEGDPQIPNFVVDTLGSLVPWIHEYIALRKGDDADSGGVGGGGGGGGSAVVEGK